MAVHRTVATAHALKVDAEHKRQCENILQGMYTTAMDLNEPTQSRVSAGKTFLAKFMPDLKAVDVDINGDMTLKAMEVTYVRPD
jgi:hypothetical protein